MSVGVVLVTSGCYDNKNAQMNTENLMVYDSEATTKEPKNDIEQVSLEETITTEKEVTEEVNKEIEVSTEIEPATEKTTEEVTTEIITEEITTFETTEYYTEDNVIEEFILMEQEVNDSIGDKAESILSKVGDKVATMIGFIWYGEEIKGYTYKELSDSAKEKVLNIFYKIDGKIENKIPNYKESIKSKYDVVASFISDKFDDLKYSVDNWLKEALGEDKYSEMKNDIKEGIDNSIEDIKDVTEKGKQKIYEWYQKKKSE